MCVYIYIYMYIEREREITRKQYKPSTSFASQGRRGRAPSLRGGGRHRSSLVCRFMVYGCSFAIIRCYHYYHY